MGLDAVGVNPAGLALGARELNTQYQTLPAETSAGAVGVAVPVGKSGLVIGGSYLGLQSAGLEGRSSSGEATGSFSQQDQMAGLHVAKRMTGGLLAGASVKALSSRVEGYRGTGYAMDFGASYGVGNLTLSGAALNLGRGPKLQAEVSKLPTSYGLAGGYQMMKSLALVGGLKVESGSVRGSVGAEYGVGDTLTLRGGYALAESLTGMDGLAGGIGLKLGNQSLDYVFQPYAEGVESGAAGSHRATLTLRF
jgi:hypothetical protein